MSGLLFRYLDFDPLLLHFFHSFHWQQLSRTIGRLLLPPLGTLLNSELQQIPLLSQAPTQHFWRQILEQRCNTLPCPPFLQALRAVLCRRSSVTKEVGKNALYGVVKLTILRWRLEKSMTLKENKMIGNNSIRYTTGFISSSVVFCMPGH